MATNQIYGLQSLLSKLFVADSLLPALIDSGAAVSVIRSSDFKLLRDSSSSFKLEQSNIHAAAINGSELHIVGVCSLPCRWYKGSRIFSFKFFAAQSLSVPLIVGFDLLHSQKCFVDFHLDLLFVQNAVLECTSPVLKTEHKSTQLPVVIQATLKVPPFSEAIVPYRIINSSTSQSALTESAG